MWNSGASFASFDKQIKLLELGMTIEEMFGTELTKKAQVFLNKNEKEPEINEDDFERKVREILIKYHNNGIKGISN